jgi:type 1 glutamine amidotransferase
MLAAAAGTVTAAIPRLLVFSGQPPGIYRHDGIDYALDLMKTLAPKAGFAYDTSTDYSVFTDANLSKYQAILMNCNCRETRLITTAGRAALEKFIHNGGGWAGTHCAAALDLDINWPWYTSLLGAVHRHHTDGSQPGVLRVDDHVHPSTAHFKSNTWTLSKEELYFYLKDPVPAWKPDTKLPKVNVLLTFVSWGNGQTKPPAGNKADSSEMGALAWYHEFEGGRSWYSGLGHEKWLFSDSLYIKHLMGGLKYVLKSDGTSGLDDQARLHPVSHAQHAWIGSFQGSSSSPFAETGPLHGYRIFDIQGTRLRELESGSGSPAAAILIGIQASHEK